MAAHACTSSSQTCPQKRSVPGMAIDLHRRIIDGYSVVGLGLSIFIIRGKG
jgi:hypothetical protein